MTVVSACAATCDVDKLQCRLKSLQTACRLQVHWPATRSNWNQDRHSRLWTWQ